MEAVPKEDLGELHHGDHVANAGAGVQDDGLLGMDIAASLSSPWRAAGWREGGRSTKDNGGAVESVGKKIKKNEYDTWGSLTK